MDLEFEKAIQVLKDHGLINDNTMVLEAETIIAEDTDA